jgi:hypothetical protein
MKPLSEYTYAELTQLSKQVQAELIRRDRETITIHCGCSDYPHKQSCRLERDKRWKYSA